jgi:hypothetical protein
MRSLKLVWHGFCQSDIKILTQCLSSNGISGPALRFAKQTISSLLARHEDADDSFWYYARSMPTKRALGMTHTWNRLCKYLP